MARAEASVIAAQRACPAGCGHEVELLAELEFGAFDDVPLDRCTRLVACRHCGQTYNDGAFDQATLDTFYRDHGSYAVELTAGGGMDPWDMDRYELALKVLERHIQSDHPNIIDVGCANGGFISTLTRFGYDRLYGVDLSINRVEHVRHICKLPAALGSTDKLPYRDVTPDVLVYSHLIEHLYDPQRALQEAHDRLADDGFVYLEVADASRYGELPVCAFHWLGQSERVTHFDTHHLANLARRSGFTPVETGQLTAPISETITIPVCYAVLRKAEAEAVQPDVALGHALRRYVEEQREAIQDRQATIATLAKKGSPVILWGIDHELFCLYDLAGLNRCPLTALVDDSLAKQDRTVNGLPVLSRERLKEATAEDTVVITSASGRPAMERHLNDIGFAGAVVALG